MIRYREILRLHHLEFSIHAIAKNISCSRNTASKVIRSSQDLGISWCDVEGKTDREIQKLLFPEKKEIKLKHKPDFNYIHKELLRKGVTRKLLWLEYLEDCKASGYDPLMYTQFCEYIRKDEEQRHASMSQDHDPGMDVEVDWAGLRPKLIDPDTGEEEEAHVFVGVLPYSQYPYVEAFPDEAMASWIYAHVHMFDYFGGVPRIIIPDNCATAVDRKGVTRSADKRINKSYYHMAEYYGTAIMPTRVRKPKDKPSVEGSVGKVTMAVLAPLRNEQFFSVKELNAAIQERMGIFIHNNFQKKDFSRADLFKEEKDFLLPLPGNPYKMCEYKFPTVDKFYRVQADGMYYSVPFSYIHKTVELRIMEKTIEVFFDGERIASHERLYGRKVQKSIKDEHMPPNHRHYVRWTGEQYRHWAINIGQNAFKVVDGVLKSRNTEELSYNTCRAFVNLEKKYSSSSFEIACEEALTYSNAPSLNMMKAILSRNCDNASGEEDDASASGITRGADYYKRR